MSASTLLRGLALLAALLIVWGALRVFRGGVGDTPTGLEVPRLTAADVDRVLIEAADTARIERAAAGWAVNGHEAAADKVTDLISAITDTGLSTELVARSAGSHARLGVDSASGRRVRFLKGDRVLLDLVLGNQGRAYQTAYVRRAGEDEVYLLRGRLAAIVDADVDGWRDRRIGGVTGDSVFGLRLERGGRATALTRAEGGWRLGGAPADSAAVAQLLSRLAEITASGFATEAQADSLDFDRPDRRLVVTGSRGDTLLGLAFDSAAGGIWARRLTGGPVFRLDSWRFDELTPADSVFRKKTG